MAHGHTDIAAHALGRTDIFVTVPAVAPAVESTGAAILTLYFLVPVIQAG